MSKGLEGGSVGIGGGVGGGGCSVMRWSWRARREEKKIFGLEGHEDEQHV